ncbi:hypothetical protein J6590_030551 [Homalodisca vitripennis]|nr:hypothetical protein J6590_030551 [Homalodisca vitripennis]
MKIKIVLVLLLAILGYTLVDATPEDRPRTGKCDISCPAVYSPVGGMDSKGNSKDFGNCCEIISHNECYGTDYHSNSCSK